jgi:DNA-directed RNA polymerase specialized sigma24 family protein
LNKLGEVDSRKSSVVELRFFGGLSIKETAAVLKISTDTVTRDWNLAKAWLLRYRHANWCPKRAPFDNSSPQVSRNR